MRRFGWCNDGFHADYDGNWSAPCIGSYQRVVKDVKGRGKKKVETVVKNETVYCGCPCHGEPEEKPKKRKRKK